MNKLTNNDIDLCKIIINHLSTVSNESWVNGGYSGSIEYDETYTFEIFNFKNDICPIQNRIPKYFMHPLRQNGNHITFFIENVTDYKNDNSPTFWQSNNFQIFFRKIGFRTPLDFFINL